MSEDQRRFQYQSYDLNDDGRDEYLVGLENSFFCGSGGCTYLLLSGDGKLITRFTVSMSPFIVQEQKTNGWHNLLVENGGRLRQLVFDGKSYPSDPAAQPEYKMIPGDEPAAAPVTCLPRSELYFLNIERVGHWVDEL